MIFIGSACSGSDGNSGKAPNITHEVNFYTNSGDSFNIPSQTVQHGKLARKPNPDPSKEGYIFTGWYKDDTFTQLWYFEVDTVTTTITLIAGWTPVRPEHTYVVSFDLNYETDEKIESQIIKYGKFVEQPDPLPSRAGYTFGGWFKDAECTLVWNFSVDMVTKDTTLYARWLEN